MSLKQESERSSSPTKNTNGLDFLLNRPYGTGDGENGNTCTSFRSLFLRGCYSRPEDTEMITSVVVQISRTPA